MKSFVLLLTLFAAGSALGHDQTEPKKLPGTLAANKPIDAVDLSIRLVDDATGKPLSGCIRIRGKESSSDPAWIALPPLFPRGTGLSKERAQLGWYVVPEGKATVAAPKGSILIQAISGVEYSSKLVETSAADIEIRLKRLFNPAVDGWVAGNTHLHLKRLTRDMADRYLTEISRGDGLKIVFVSYLERALVDNQYISNRYSNADLKRLSTKDLIFGSGEEYRHNIGGGGEGYGHVMLLAHASRILPASIGPGITEDGTDGTPLRPGIDRARSDGGTVIWCHNAFGFEDLPSWLSDRVDAQNIFDGGNHGNYEDTFYRYLNLGMHVPFSTGTDWFIYDFSRVYARLDQAQLDPGQQLSVESWLKALRDGRSVITNGPWIELQVDEAAIGDTIDLDAAKTVRVSAQAIGRHAFEALEIVRNGEVIHTVAAKQGSASAKIELKINKPAWIAARIKPARRERNELGEPLFAHTSPIYITIGGRGVYSVEIATEIAEEMEQSIKEITKHGVFADDSERESVLQIYRTAIDELRRVAKNRAE